MTDHVIKCWPEYFKPIAKGEKTFDLRKDDRSYAVGDIVLLCEFRPTTGEYTGPTIRVKIGYILREFAGLMPGYCILGIERISDDQH
jgi:ParB family transcriptional regulator, chromosome partitioning protein